MCVMCPFDSIGCADCTDEGLWRPGPSEGRCIMGNEAEQGSTSVQCIGITAPRPLDLFNVLQNHVM